MFAVGLSDQELYWLPMVFLVRDVILRRPLHILVLLFYSMQIQLHPSNGYGDFFEFWGLIDG